MYNITYVYLLRGNDNSHLSTRTNEKMVNKGKKKIISKNSFTPSHGCCFPRFWD